MRGPKILDHTALHNHTLLFRREARRRKGKQKVKLSFFGVVVWLAAKRCHRRVVAAPRRVLLVWCRAAYSQGKRVKPRSSASEYPKEPMLGGVGEG